MARIPTAVSRGTIATPSGPFAPLSLGDNSALTRTADTVTRAAGTILGQVVAARAKQDKEMKEAENVTYAYELVMAAQNDLQRVGDDMRTDEIGQTDPRQAQQNYRTFVNNVVKDTIKEGAKADPRIGEFVARQLTPFAVQQMSTFNGEMTGRWVEKQQLKVDGQITELRKMGVSANPLMNGTGLGPEDIKAKINNILEAHVGTLFTAEQAAERRDAEFKGLQFDRAADTVRARREEYLTARMSGRTPEFIPAGMTDEDMQKFDKIARESITFFDQQFDREEKLRKAEQEKIFDQARLDAEAAVIEGTKTEAEIARELRSGIYRPADGHALITLAHAREKEERDGENVHTEPVLGATIASKLASPNPRTVASVKESDLIDLVRQKKMNWKDAQTFLNKRREALNFFRNETQTLYDKTAQEGEQQIEIQFRTTGLLDFDKLANQAMGDALFEFRERWRARRGSGENPLEWVPEIIGRHQKVIADRVFADVSKRIRGLPDNLKTPELAQQAFNRGEVSKATFLHAIELHDKVAQAQEFGATSLTEIKSRLEGGGKSKQGKAATR